MKLLNYTSGYFAAILLVVISIWAGIFYYAMLDEIYDSIDDGLDNQKGLIIQKAVHDSLVLEKNDFDERDYAVEEITARQAIGFHDVYIDTMMYMQNEESEEPVRMLTTVFTQNGHYYKLRVATSMVEEDDLVKQLLYSLLWLYGGLVISIVVLNNVLLKRIWRPFYQLLKHVKKFQLDKPAAMEQITSHVDEFRLLIETVSKLLQRNIETYTSQKQFIENASHELQTPLAIGINKLEMLADQPGLSEEQLKLLSSALDNLERLTRLNRSLLLLSKIENRQFSIEQDVNINELSAKIVDDFSDQSSYNKLTVTVHEDETCIHRMNPDLALVMLTNLIKNAVIHNIPGGTISVILKSKSITVQNTGNSEALDDEKIFHRFHSQQPSAVSTGLGLALVKAVVELYHFRVSYKYDDLHSITVNFSPQP